MGFRPGAYAKVWEVTPFSDTMTKLRISVSNKNKQTGEYNQSFSYWVNALGTAAAKKAACLKPGSRIKIGDMDVENPRDKEKGVTYWNCKLFSFDVMDEDSAPKPTTEPQPAVDSGELDDSRLPF